MAVCLRAVLAFSLLWPSYSVRIGQENNETESADTTGCTSFCVGCQRTHNDKKWYMRQHTNTARTSFVFFERTPFGGDMCKSDISRFGPQPDHWNSVNKIHMKAFMNGEEPEGVNNLSCDGRPGSCCRDGAPRDSEAIRKKCYALSQNHGWFSPSEEVGACAHLPSLCGCAGAWTVVKTSDKDGCLNGNALGWPLPDLAQQ
eukprot:TRINITY_DN120979_c0_g1_i1.p1 TRINITY_DN120979_c0_g1~~TRINITY_DN120979_c0_g1_i1.p1  ORF type:complete len:201 (+),score=12.19 TRINITY_DN120979_c0_g1_i1:50-652(+)